MSEFVHVVAGIRTRATAVFVARRIGPAHAGCWEYPGGKIDSADANERHALIREWGGEFGMGIEVKERVGETLTFADHTPPFTLTAYKVVARTGIAGLYAHDAFRWMTPEAVLALPDEVCTPSLKPITRAYIAEEAKRV